jgi:hypothetical protein
LTGKPGAGKFPRLMVLQSLKNEERGTRKWIGWSPHQSLPRSSFLIPPSPRMDVD